MNGLPLISVVVPSFNQARFIGETLQSLVDQQYPNLEVIVQDGGSTDGAVEIAREFVERHPATFSLFVEKDTGHAQAVNRGMRRTHGEILGYLNTDDTLYPGCLHSAAREIDPSRGRHVVFGRCVFTGEGSVYVGTEHPAEFQSHFNHLAIWRRGFNTIPQPATFWHRRVYERCGDFDEKHNHGLDYLQWCRFSRYFRFHKVDEMWATYRMHAASVSANKSEQDWLDIMTQYSRMSWGPWWHPVRWRCAISYWVHGHEFHEQARHHARRAEESWGGRRYLQAVWQAMLTTRYSPTMTWHRLLQPLLAEKSYAALALVLLRSNGNGAAEFTGQVFGQLDRAGLPSGTEAAGRAIQVESRARTRAAAGRTTLQNQDDVTRGRSQGRDGTTRCGRSVQCASRRGTDRRQGDDQHRIAHAALLCPATRLWCARRSEAECTAT